MGIGRSAFYDTPEARAMLAEETKALESLEEAASIEALKIEATFGHGKLRTKVEELDPLERF